MHGHIRERERKIHNYVKPQTSQFCYTEAHRYYTWLAGFNGEMIIYVFLLGFFSPSRQKDDMSVKYKRLPNLTHHKHEPQSSLAKLCIEMLI